jgi:acyl carrier protein
LVANIFHHLSDAVVREDRNGSTTTKRSRRSTWRTTARSGRENGVAVTDDANASSDERLVLRDIRALLDQLQLDRGQTLTMESELTNHLGVDSLALVELCEQLERTFDVSLPDEVFLIATTPQQWLDAVERARDGDSIVSDVRHTSDSPRQASPSPVSRLSAVAKRVWSLASAWRRGIHAAATSTPGLSPKASESILYALYAWSLLVPFAFTIWLLAVSPLSLTQRRNAGRALARVTCRALALSVSVEGELPTNDDPSVIAANHSSFIDGLLLYVFLNQPVTFVASTDMEHQFILGRIMRGFGCVFVDRGKAERSAASVEKLVNAIQSGRHVLIFPEGSISTRAGLRVFRLGAFEAATSSNCPVIPIGIRGSREVLPPSSFRPHRGVVRIVIGNAVAPTGREFSDRVVMRDAVREAIAQLCGEEDA